MKVILLAGAALVAASVKNPALPELMKWPVIILAYLSLSCIGLCVWSERKDKATKAAFYLWLTCCAYSLVFYVEVA